MLTEASPWSSGSFASWRTRHQQPGYCPMQKTTTIWTNNQVECLVEYITRLFVSPTGLLERRQTAPLLSPWTGRVRPRLLTLLLSLFYHSPPSPAFVPPSTGSFFLLLRWIVFVNSTVSPSAISITGDKYWGNLTLLSSSFRLHNGLMQFLCAGKKQKKTKPISWWIVSFFSCHYSVQPILEHRDKFRPKLVNYCF